MTDKLTDKLDWSNYDNPPKFIEGEHGECCSVTFVYREKFSKDWLKHTPNKMPEQLILYNCPRCNSTTTLNKILSNK